MRGYDHGGDAVIDKDAVSPSAILTIRGFRYGWNELCLALLSNTNALLMPMRRRDSPAASSI
jgi:hypothetical protein